MGYLTRSKNGFSRTLVLAFAGTLLIAGSAWAQVLEEIVVTAQKRAEDLQDTPVAVTAFTGEQLQQAGVYDAIGLSNIVPNVTIATEDARDAIFINIRGISQSERRNTSDPTTAFYMDGALVPRMSGINAYFYDVERIEVLRGPQGTLYGRNSTSGVVNVITKKPDLEAIGGDIQVGYGNYDAVDVTGALNVPFSDSFGARVAFTYNERDGYRDNSPVADGDDLDDIGVRGHLLWDISDNTSLLLSADYYEHQGVGPVLAQVECPDLGCNIPIPPDPADANPLNTEGFRDSTDTNFKVELNHSLSFADLTFIGSYRDHERDYLMDTDGTGASVFLPPAGRLVPIDTIVVEQTESESFSSELRLNSNTDGRFQWILGGFYLDEDIAGDFRYQPVLPNGAHLNVQFVDKGFNVESWAVFANASVDVTDRFTLNGGIRYTEDEKDKGGVNDPSNPTAGSYMTVTIRELGRPVAPVFPRAQVANPSWSEVTYSFGLDWHINDDTLVYIKNSKGFKSGGFNRGSVDPFNPSGAFNVANLIVYNPEQVLATEGGIKSTFMGGRARANFSLFWYDYSDKEEAVVRVIGGIPTNTAINAGQATIYGAELETSFLYGDHGGRINVNIGWLNAEFDEFVGLDDPLTAGQDNLDLGGGEMVNAPDWNIGVTWVPVELEMMNGILHPMVQFSFKSDYITRPHNQSVDQQDSYTRTNASLHWESNKTGLFLEGFVHNIENEDIQTVSTCQQMVNGVAGTPFPGLGCTHMYQPPRTYGVRLGYRF